ncbi:hypothetical protein B484DRAFT_66814 [Ochromonadaceae sp. CCMP2298]|nr:hypothetical protein B484DRAFT_66814 [Ochromonadaceae sp. CCMP2298]
MLKLTFNLKVDRAELGALLKEFDRNIDHGHHSPVPDESGELPGASEPAPKLQIPASEFLRFFLRLGINGRDAALRAQRKKQKHLDVAAIAQQESKLSEAQAKMNQDIDFNFSMEAEDKAQEKLRAAAARYDRNAPGAQALDGFECDSLDPGQFKDLIRRVFNLKINASELGFLISKYDSKSTGRVLCKTFLTDFLRMGQEMRYKVHIEQLEKQRRMNREAEESHVKKMHDVQNSDTVRISQRYGEQHLQSALDKLTEAATRYDKVRGVSLISFEPAKLSPLEFQKGLKRTFNIKLTPQEMGAAVEYFDKDGTRMVQCQAFLSTFTILGQTKKSEIRTHELKQQRDEWEQARMEGENKILEMTTKVLYEVNFDFDDIDREESADKITLCATKYDASHPASLGLDGFERRTMAGAEFKELVRRTFGLKLTAREVGAVFERFHAEKEEINCKDFLNFFLQLGITERAKVKSGQIERQKREDRDREKEHEQKIHDLANRQTFTFTFDYTEADTLSINEKINKASEGFDKSHPAAPSLEAFDVAYMPPGVFRENLKRVFNIVASGKEVGVLMDQFDKAKLGQIDSKDFLNKFQAIGKAIRDDKRRKFLEETRKAQKEAKLEEERKTAAMWEKAELDVDYDTTNNDLRSAIVKMTEASFKYDKSHASAPRLDGFSGGPIKPGVFRELMRRAFGVNFEAKELGAVVKKFPHYKLHRMVDGKMFLIAFMKLGYDARARAKAYSLQKQRGDAAKRKQEEELRLLQSASRVVLDVDPDWAEEHMLSAVRKLTQASAQYDKNAPGCVALDAFDASFLTPGMFREVAKKTFNIVFEPKELSAMLYAYDDGHGNLSCAKFLVAFVRMGSEEREQQKGVQLEKQRQENYMRRSEHDRKIQELESKLVIDLKYDYTPAQMDSAFQKMAHAAKRFDKNHPGAMSLEGFEEKTLKPHVFREMIKRTFGVVFDNSELSAAMHYFDPKKKGVLPSKKFLIYFLKLGIAARENDHKASLDKLRSDAVFRERWHEEKLVAQWAKMELNLTFDFSEEDRESALAKLGDAAFKFDPASPGPMGLTAFQGQKMTPAVFKEMLRRSFNMRINEGELAALIAEFDRDESRQINCAEFMVRFTTLGFERRSAMRTAQLERQRTMDVAAGREAVEKRIAADSKMDANVSMDFDSNDFNTVLERIRVLASNYDRSHPSAPSLRGFTGTNMSPMEFKDMLMRTFNMPLTDRQLGAVVSVFGVEKDDTVSVRDKHKTEGVRVNNAEFLKYFNKIQREEQSKRNRERIQRERDLLAREKDHHEQLVAKKKQEELHLLINSPVDEETLLEKIRQAAADYAVDSAMYNEVIQGFKGPAFQPDKFREIFAQIFSIKLTFPELGVLLGILDLGGIGSIDGGKFLNWFYKLSRHEERFLLGEQTESLTFDFMRSATASGSPTRASTARPAAFARSPSSKFSAIALSWDTKEDDFEPPTQPRSHFAKPKPGSSASPFHISSRYGGGGLGFDEEEEPSVGPQNSQAFTTSTLQKSWLLPTITAPASAPGMPAFGSMAARSEEDELMAGEEARRHLQNVFSMELDSADLEVDSPPDKGQLVKHASLSAMVENGERGEKGDQARTRTAPNQRQKGKPKRVLSPGPFLLTNGSVSSTASRMGTATGKRLDPLALSAPGSEVAIFEPHRDEAQFLITLFAAQSPYAHMLKVPTRHPTSTSKKQRELLVQLQMAKKHFHDTPIAHKRMQERERDAHKQSMFRPQAPDSLEAGSSIVSSGSFIPHSATLSRPDAAVTAVTKTASPGKTSPTSTAELGTVSIAPLSPQAPALTATVPVSGQKVAPKRKVAKVAPAIEKSPKPKDKGGFFFPPLLSSQGLIVSEQGSVVGEESEEEGAGEEEDVYHAKKKEKARVIDSVPNIDVVGVQVELEDFAFLQSIF